MLKSKRKFIYRKDLSLFSMYLRKNHWRLAEAKWPWELFRAVNSEYRRPIIVYKSNDILWFPMNDRGYGIFEGFLKWLKEEVYEVD